MSAARSESRKIWSALSYDCLAFLQATISRTEMRELTRSLVAGIWKLNMYTMRKWTLWTFVMGHGKPVLHLLLPRPSSCRFMVFVQLLSSFTTLPSINHWIAGRKFYHSPYEFRSTKRKDIGVYVRGLLFLAIWLSSHCLQLRCFFTDDGVKQRELKIHGSVDWVREFHEKHHAVKTPVIIKTWPCIVHGVKQLSGSEGGQFKLWRFRPMLGYPGEHVKVISFISTCSCLASRF